MPRDKDYTGGCAPLWERAVHLVAHSPARAYRDRVAITLLCTPPEQFYNILNVLGSELDIEFLHLLIATYFSDCRG